MIMLLYSESVSESKQTPTDGCLDCILFSGKSVSKPKQTNHTFTDGEDGLAT